uniref:Ionization receptor 75q1 n=2 Tax=Mythimna separata TaxID=271217 RepID=A0A2D0WKS7_MYTSE|nr:ionization receptor 75q1 [Mythimna separata]
MKILSIFINIFCLKYCVSITNLNYELQMIVDVVKSYEKPTSVIARVCWESSAAEIKLPKMLANLERPISVRYLRENETIQQPYPNNHLLFLLDKNCEHAEFFLKQAGAHNLFSKSYRWLVLGNSIQDNGNIAAEFEGLSISVDSEVIITEEKERNDILLHTIYKLRPNNEWNKEYYGTWSADYGLNKSEDRIHSNVLRRKDFKGEPVTTSVVIGDNRTKTDLLGLGNIFVDTLSKSSFRCIDPLYDFLNASRVILFAETWGYPINGTWNGMIGDIKRGKVDLCGIVTFITLERLPILEYLNQPTPVTAKFVFRQPPLSYQNNLFILPFTSNVWMCLGAFVLILTAILYINTKWDSMKYEKFNEQTLDQTCLPPTWSDITIFLLSAISQQGSSNELKGTLGRLVMFIIFLAFVFLYTSYSANIVVLLQSTSNQIRTLPDLLNSKLELGVEDVAYNRYYFSAAYTSKDPIKKAIFERKVAPKGKPNYMSIEDGVKAIQKRPFAFNMNTGTGYRIVSAFFREHEKCGLQEIDYIQNSKPWLCSQKYSPFGEMFKVGYIRIQEHGLSDRENRLIYAKKPVCSVMGGSFDSVNMVDFYPVCLLLLYGKILAFVLLGLEILVHRLQKRRSNEIEI